MDATFHHRRLVEALKKHWAEAGGPVSLTFFLRESRPTIAPLLARNISWAWIGARIIAVYTNPYSDVPDQLAPLDRGKRSLIELYSRTTRMLEEGGSTGVAALSCKDDTAKDGTEAGASQETNNASDTDRSAIWAAGTDPPGGRRARIRRSGVIRQNLEPS